MKRILTIIFLVLGIFAMPIVHAADEAPADQKKEQKATGDKKDGKAGESGEKKEEKKGGGGGGGGGAAEPECS